MWSNLEIFTDGSNLFAYCLCIDTPLFGLLILVSSTSVGKIVLLGP